MFIFIIYIP